MRCVECSAEEATEPVGPDGRRLKNPRHCKRCLERLVTGHAERGRFVTPGDKDSRTDTQRRVRTGKASDDPEDDSGDGLEYTESLYG